MTIQFSLFRINNLPTRYDDETIYSWCGAIHLANGYTSVLETSIGLFKNKYAGRLHDFPAHIDSLIANTCICKESDTLALRNTLLGYFLAFKTPELSDFVLKKVTTKAYPQLKYKLGIPASRLGGSHPLKACCICIDEQLKNFGRSYWKVEHQYPSSLICTEHQSLLKIYNNQSSPVHLRKWLYPGSDNFMTSSIVSLSNEQCEKLSKLAQFSQAAAKEPSGSFLPINLSVTYQSRIKELGFLTSRGSIRMTEFLPWVKNYYKNLRHFEELSILKTLDNMGGSFIAKIIRKQPKQAHPFKHLLLLICLFDSWEDFIKKYQEVNKSVPEWKLFHEPKKKKDNPLKNEFLSILKKEKCSIRSVCIRLGISTTTGTQWAKQANIKFTNRAKTLSSKRISKATKLLKKGLDKKEVVILTGISEVSINRLLGANQILYEKWKKVRFEITKKKYREHFLVLLDSYPGLPINNLRKIPGNGYHWLYRNDRSWLSEHLPKVW